MSYANKVSVYMLNISAVVMNVCISWMNLFRVMFALIDIVGLFIRSDCGHLEHKDNDSDVASSKIKKY